MPGINDSTLVHGVLDLIEQRLKKTSSVSNEWDGTPSVLISREHPLDEWVVTTAMLHYPSGYTVSIVLNRGMTPEEMEQAIASNMNTAYLPPVFIPPDQTDEELDPFNFLSPEEQDPTSSIPSVEGGGHGTYNIKPTIPLDVVDKNHQDYDYYLNWRLKNVVIEKSDSSGTIIESLILHMVYDSESRLVASLVENEVTS